MPETKCVAPQQQLRDVTSDMVGMLENANNIAEFIEDKLFGLNPPMCSEAACPPNNVQNGLDRSVNALNRLISKLDSISSRL